MTYVQPWIEGKGQSLFQTGSNIFIFFIKWEFLFQLMCLLFSRNKQTALQISSAGFWSEPFYSQWFLSVVQTCSSSLMRANKSMKVITSQLFAPSSELWQRKSRIICTGSAANSPPPMFLMNLKFSVVSLFLRRLGPPRCIHLPRLWFKCPTTQKQPL